MNMNNSQDPFKSPMEWLFRASVLLFGIAVLLNLAVAYLTRILPWLIGGVVFISAVSIIVVVVRWRRSRW